MSAPDDDTTNGQILRELAGMRRDLQAFSEQGESRHRALANDVLAISARVDRAVEVANEAKRIADRSSHDTLQMQTSVVEHTRGLAARQAEQAAKIDALNTETSKQTTSLTALLTAETERKVREDERKLLDEKRWKWITRAGLVGAPCVTFVGWLIAHWRP